MKDYISYRLFNRIPGLPPQNKKLRRIKQIIKFPILTEELVSVISLIAPQYSLSPNNKRHKKYIELDQNGCCYNEYKVLMPLFNQMSRPSKILEIGPGLGRSLIFYNKKLKWQESEFHAYEGDGSSTKYTLLGPRFSDSFCGNTKLLKSILAYNGISNVTIFDAHKVKLNDLPGPYDFLYSYYCIGFHWSLEHFLDDLLGLMHDKSIMICTIPNHFEVIKPLKDLTYKIVTWELTYPKDSTHSMLIFSKKASKFFEAL